jgi:diguanylate cyclase (GGDEF)-like protein
MTSLSATRLTRFRDLPVGARLFVSAVMAAGAILAAISPFRGAFAHPLLLLSLVATSIAAHTVKVSLPATRSTSTLSFGYAVSFASLLVLGPAATAWPTMAGALAQCTIRTQTPNRWYQTAFSMTALAVSMEAAGQALAWTGGRSLNAPADIVIPAIVAATLAYFLVNSIMMATVLGLTTGQSIVKIWDRDFLWAAPNAFMGALAATVAVLTIGRFGLESIVLLMAPLFLTYRLYKVYLERMDDMQRANAQLHSLYEQAQAESMTDPLTLLPNRRFLTSHAVNELARARRELYDVSVLLVDLDDFKTINDRYGHERGDAALRTVAKCLRSGLRSYDVCGRQGGDEFVLILPRCDADLAAARAAELAEAVAQGSREDLPALETPLSISVGVAVFPFDGSAYEALLAAADARMYRQKERRPARSPRSDEVIH